jgi:hypothetical protein
MQIKNEPKRFILVGGAARNTRSIRDPSWEKIEERINQIKVSGGSMRLEISEGGEFSFDAVDVDSEQGKFLLTYFITCQNLKTRLLHCSTFPKMQEVR